MTPTTAPAAGSAFSGWSGGGTEQEFKETFRGLVEQGVSIREVYPPDEETLRRYEARKRETRR